MEHYVERLFALLRVSGQCAVGEPEPGGQVDYVHDPAGSNDCHRPESSASEDCHPFNKAGIGRGDGDTCMKMRLPGSNGSAGPLPSRCPFAYTEADPVMGVSSGKLLLLGAPDLGVRGHVSGGAPQPLVK